MNGGSTGGLDGGGGVGAQEVNAGGTASMTPTPSPPQGYDGGSGYPFT